MDAHELVATATRLLTTQSPARSSPWITVGEAASRARCGIKLIYREVSAGQLHAVRVGGRRELRLRADWVDAWLLGRSQVDGRTRSIR